MSTAPENHSPANSRPLRHTRRGFIRKSLAGALAAPLVGSFEEANLVTQARAAGPATPAVAKGAVPLGKLGALQVSRVICGGNLVSGYAHSRDLIYVSSLLKHYFTDEKIFETWARCEAQGINTMVATSSDRRIAGLYQRYVARGGKIQYLAQVNPAPSDLTTAIAVARDAGAVGAFLLGNLGDRWVREGAVGRVGEVVEIIRDNGLVAGVAGHELRTHQAIEKAGIACDYYVKTLHSDNYWSKRKPDQTAEVVDNYTVDNYWCRDAQPTIGFMAKTKVPWIAYKVLAAGAIKPKDGFKFAFENGADFVLAGMFDFQVDEDAAIARDLLAGTLNRTRAWMA